MTLLGAPWGEIECAQGGVAEGCTEVRGDGVRQGEGSGCRLIILARWDSY